MNKYVAFGLIAFAALALDLWTKRMAEEDLASVSRRWEHPIERVVDGDDTESGAVTLEEWVARELGDDALSHDPPLAQGFYLVQGGDQVGPLRRDYQLDAGDVVRIYHREVIVVPGFWNHVYVQNFGAAWGFMSDGDERFVRPFFLVVAVLAVIMVLWYFRSVHPSQLRLMFAFPLVVGGALGNFVDRARYGYVVDFIDWYVTVGGEEKHWPTFNVADVWIAIGVGLMILDILFGGPTARAAEDAKRAAGESSAEPTA